MEELGLVSESLTLLNPHCTCAVEQKPESAVLLEEQEEVKHRLCKGLWKARDTRGRGGEGRIHVRAWGGGTWQR